MRQLKIILILMGSFLLSACATPQPGPHDPLLITPDAQRVVKREGEVKANSPQSEVRCELIRRTGSHMVKRFCYTETEERRQERNARDSLETMLNRTTCSDCGGDG